MKKPRDLDAELAALQHRAKALKGRRVSQLGELVIATGADRMEMEVLAGALLASAKADAATRDGWRRAGSSFFQRETRPPGGAHRNRERRAADDGGQAAG